MATDGKYHCPLPRRISSKNECPPRCIYSDSTKTVGSTDTSCPQPYDEPGCHNWSTQVCERRENSGQCMLIQQENNNECVWSCGHLPDGYPTIMEDMTDTTIPLICPNLADQVPQGPAPPPACHDWTGQTCERTEENGGPCMIVQHDVNNPCVWDCTRPTNTEVIMMSGMDDYSIPIVCPNLATPPAAH